MSQSPTIRVLPFSIALNLLAATVAARSIYARGGWDYMEGKLKGGTEYHTIDTDATFAHRQSLSERLALREDAIVCAGDRLTQNCEWSEFYPGALNRGIGGDTSAGLLRRIGTIAAMRPRAIVFMIGSSDLFNLHLGPQGTVANIRGVIAELQRSSPTTAIYVESNLPTWASQKNQHSITVNRSLKSLSSAANAVYLDLYASFLEGSVLKPAFTSDRGHLNGEGYLQWKRLIDPYVRRVLEGQGR